MERFSDWEAAKAELQAAADRLERLEVEFVSGWSDIEARLSDHGNDSLISNEIGAARARLDRAVIEVGVFGEVKAGKSTLLNALVGQHVSSMRVTPETAVPVWVERGRPPARLVFAGGKVEDVTDPVAAMEATSQRWSRRRDGTGNGLVRVVCCVDSPLVGPGVRLIDTPGLSDPALSVEYEELAMAELERVAAAIFVFVSPPGIDQREAELLRSIARGPLDKAFLVCNYHSDQWEDPEARGDVARYIREVVTEACTVDGNLAHEAVRLYEVHAKRAWQAAEQGDEDAFRDSGVARLRDDLERFLSSGAFELMDWLTRSSLDSAAEQLIASVERRLRFLRDPREVDVLRDEVEAKIGDVGNEMERVVAEVRRRARTISDEAERMLCVPYDEAAEGVAGITRRSDVEGLDSSLRMRTEAAVSKADHLLTVELTDLSEQARVQVRDAFGDRAVLHAPGDPGRVQHSVGGTLAYRSGVGREGWGALAGIGGAAAVGGSLIGGSLAGGIGIALVAAGPVGWAIGAGIGAVLGLLGGLAGGGAWVSGNLSREAQADLRSGIASRRHEAQAEIQRIVSGFVDDLVLELRQAQAANSRELRAELESLNRYRADQAGRAARAKEAEQLRAEVAALREELARR